MNKDIFKDLLTNNNKSKEELESKLMFLEKTKQTKNLVYSETAEALNNFYTIEYYNSNYPNCIFLTDKDFNLFCEKYKLNTSNVENYIKDYINNDNFEDIQNFKISARDIMNEDGLMEYGLNPDSKINFEDLKDYGIALKIACDKKYIGEDLEQLFDENRIYEEFKKTDNYDENYGGVLIEKKEVNNIPITIVEILPVVESKIQIVESKIQHSINSSLDDIKFLFLQLKTGYLIISEV